MHECLRFVSSKNPPQVACHRFLSLVCNEHATPKRQHRIPQSQPVQGYGNHLSGETKPLRESCHVAALSMSQNIMLLMEGKPTQALQLTCIQLGHITLFSSQILHSKSQCHNLFHESTIKVEGDHITAESSILIAMLNKCLKYISQFSMVAPSSSVKSCTPLHFQHAADQWRLVSLNVLIIQFGNVIWRSRIIKGYRGYIRSAILGGVCTCCGCRP